MQASFSRIFFLEKLPPQKIGDFPKKNGGKKAYTCKYPDHAFCHPQNLPHTCLLLRTYTSPIHIYIYIYIYYTHTCTHTHAQTHIRYIYIYTHTHTYIYIHIYYFHIYIPGHVSGHPSNRPHIWTHLGNYAHDSRLDTCFPLLYVRDIMIYYVGID